MKRLKQLLETLYIALFYHILIVIYWEQIKQAEMKETTLQKHSEDLKTKIRKAIQEYKIETGISQVDVSTYTAYTERDGKPLATRTDVTINITE